MTAPVYLNTGTQVGDNGNTTLNPTLPGSRVNGNVLLAVCASKNADTHSCATSGWVQWPSGVQFQYSTTLHVSFWIYEVNGSETAPSITWTNSSACLARIFQFTRAVRNLGETVGPTYSNNSGNGATHSTSSFNTSADNSLGVYIDIASANTALATPAGWTERSDTGSALAAMQLTIGDKSMPTSGGATGAISVTGANAAWIQIQLELLEPGTATYILDAQGGSYTLTGGDAGFSRGYTLDAQGGSFTLTGGTVDLIYKTFKFLGSARRFKSFGRAKSFKSRGR